MELFFKVRYLLAIFFYNLLAKEIDLNTKKPQKAKKRIVSREALTSNRPLHEYPGKYGVQEERCVRDLLLCVIGGGCQATSFST